MNVLSLFDGISCGRVALERAGIKVDKYYASEIDKYAIQITQKNYPDTIQLGDVNDYNKWELPKIDLLIGGSPCQDLSVAKKDRAGLNGERSGLFWKYVEILKLLKPKYFLLENVASMPKEAKEIITETLGVEPILINSALVSAQQRKRLYWTNIPNITQPQDKGIALKDILIKFNETESIPIEVKNQGKEIVKISPNKSQSLLARDYKGFGNQNMSGAISPIRLGEFNKGGQGDQIYSIEGKSVSLSANGGGRGAKTGLYAVPNTYINDKNIYEVKNGFIWVNDKSYAIKLPDGFYCIRKLHPIECERLQTLPDNYTEGVSNTQRYKCIGNGWTVDVISHILSFIEE